jgi:N-acetylglucosamine malate deacetylase 1
MNNSIENVLVVAAHPDDEVLGCGATIAKWSAAGIPVNILIMSEGATSRDTVRSVKSKVSELLLLKESAQCARNILGASSVKLLNLPDNRMDSMNLLDVIKIIELEIDILKPSVVVTHHVGDLNIDHRIVHEAVLTACRPQPGNLVNRILTFEVPSSTEWQTPESNISFKPNWFENVEGTIDLKIEALKAYQSEMRDWPHARSLQNVEYLSRWRGGSIGCKAAEAFTLIRELR